MNDNNKEFGEFTGLAERLGRADLSGESRVKNALKERLLAKAETRGRRSPFVWLLPAAALTAGLIVVNIWHEPPQSPSYSYAPPSDGYGECGRQGLADYMAEGRF